jgi:hypothetical protein
MAKDNSCTCDCKKLLISPYFSRWIILICNLIAFIVYVSFVSKYNLLTLLSQPNSAEQYPWLSYVFGSLFIIFGTVLGQFILMIIFCVLPEDEKTVPCLGTKRIPLALACVIVDSVSGILVGIMAIYLCINDPCLTTKPGQARYTDSAVCGFYQSGPAFMLISMPFILIALIVGICGSNKSLKRKYLS